MDNTAISQFTQTDFNEPQKKKQKPINKWRLIKNSYKPIKPTKRLSRKVNKCRPLGRIPSLPSVSSLCEPVPETMEPICSHSCTVEKGELSPQGSPPSTPRPRKRSLKDVGPKVDCWRSFRPSTSCVVEKKDSKVRLQSMLSVVDLLLSASKKENWILRASGYLLALKKEIKFCLDNKILPRLSSSNDLPTLYEPKINYKEFNPRRKFYGYVRRFRFDDFYDDEIPHEQSKTLQHETRFLPMVDPTTDIIETKLSVRPKANEKSSENVSYVNKPRVNPNENLYDILKSYCIGKSAMQHYIPDPMDHDFVEDAFMTDDSVTDDEDKLLEIKLSSFLKEMFSISPESLAGRENSRRVEAPENDVAEVLKRLQVELNLEKTQTLDNEPFEKAEENFYRSKTIKRGNKQLSPSKTPLITSVKLSELIYDNKPNSEDDHTKSDNLCDHKPDNSFGKDFNKCYRPTLDEQIKKQLELNPMKLDLIKGALNELGRKGSDQHGNARKGNGLNEGVMLNSDETHTLSLDIPDDFNLYDGLFPQSRSLPDAICFSRIKRLLRVYKEKHVDEKIRSLVTDFSDDQKYVELKKHMIRLNEVIENLAKGSNGCSSGYLDGHAENGSPCGDPQERETISGGGVNLQDQSQITGYEARQTINELINIIDNIKDISKRVYSIKKSDIPFVKIHDQAYQRLGGFCRETQKLKKSTSVKGKLKVNVPPILKKSQPEVRSCLQGRLRKKLSPRRGFQQEIHKGLTQRSSKGLPTESHKTSPNKGLKMKTLNGPSSGTWKGLQPNVLKCLLPNSRKTLRIDFRKGSLPEARKSSQPMSHKGVTQESSKGTRAKSSKLLVHEPRRLLQPESARRVQQESRKGLQPELRKGMQLKSNKGLKPGSPGLQLQSRKSLQSESRYLQESRKGTQQKSRKVLPRETRKGLQPESPRKLHQQSWKGCQPDSRKSLQAEMLKGPQSKSCKTSQAESRKLTATNNINKSPSTRRRKPSTVKRLRNGGGVKVQPCQRRLKSIVKKNKFPNGHGQCVSQNLQSKQKSRPKPNTKQPTQKKSSQANKETAKVPSQSVLSQKHDCLVSKSVLEAIRTNPNYMETAVENILKKSHSKETLVSMLLQVIHARLESEGAETLGCGDRGKSGIYSDMYDDISVTELSFNSPDVSCQSFNYLKNLYEKSSSCFDDQFMYTSSQNFYDHIDDTDTDESVAEQSIGSSSSQHVPQEAAAKSKMPLSLTSANIRLKPDTAKQMNSSQGQKNIRPVKADKDKDSSNHETTITPVSRLGKEKGKQNSMKHFSTYMRQ